MSARPLVCHGFARPAVVCTWKCLLPGRIVIFFKLDRMEAMLRCCYSWWWVALQLLFLLVVVVGDARPQIRLRPSCSTSCGGVSVPCPFGIDPDCYLLGFKLNCSTSWTPPRLFVGHGQVFTSLSATPPSTSSCGACTTRPPRQDLCCQTRPGNQASTYSRRRRSWWWNGR